MKAFFEPKSVAVIGASANPDKLGYGLVRNLEHFHGSVYPINPHEKEILYRKVYKSVLDVEGDIDLAVIIVPAPIVAKVLRECGRKGIKAVIIISAGFSEIGNKKGEKELIDIGKKYSIRILGPNNFGTANPWIGLDTSFNFTTPDSGEIAFISQSGALWAALSEWSKGRIGFSKFASLGNMIDINFSDVIEYLNKDSKTKVIICYIEKIVDGKRFMKVCRSSKKPIIVVKAGKSSAGSKAALSHTGSLAGSYKVYDAAFKQSGIYNVSTITEAFDRALFLTSQHKKGNKTVIVTNGGGVGVLMADYCSSFGLDVVDLPNSIKKLKISSNWSKSNPMDLVGDANWNTYKKVFNVLAKNKSFYDNLIVIILQQSTIKVEKTVHEILEFRRKTGKSIVCCFMGGKVLESAGKMLNKKGIPCFFEPERCARVLS